MNDNEQVEDSDEEDANEDEL
ncbi:hypothetical protein A2U01_0116413, partial [Trifolium medium]|nr:hypothetical protein [Trifolium medium]